MFCNAALLIISLVEQDCGDGDLAIWCSVERSDAQILIHHHRVCVCVFYQSKAFNPQTAHSLFNDRLMSNAHKTSKTSHNLSWSEQKFKVEFTTLI